MFKQIKIVLLSLLVLFAISACAPKTPEQVVKRMMNEMSDVSSYGVKFKLGIFGQFPELFDAESSDVKVSSGSVMFDMSGGVDLADKIKTALTGEAKYKVGGKEWPTAGELRYLDGILFLKFLSLPDAGAVDLSGLKNQWYKFDFKKELSSEEQKLDAKKTAKLKKLFGDANLIEVVADNGIDVLNSARTHHYRVKLNQENFKKFFRAASKIMEERELTALEGEDLEKSVDKLSSLTGQVWIGADDYLLRRIEFGAQANDATRYDLALELSDFSKNFAIETPQNVQDFNLADIFSVSNSDTQNSGSSVSVEEQLKSIKDVDSDELKKQLEELQKENIK